MGIRPEGAKRKIITNDRGRLPRQTTVFSAAAKPVPLPALCRQPIDPVRNPSFPDQTGLVAPITRANHVHRSSVAR
jgi:hypothetical protein